MKFLISAKHLFKLLLILLIIYSAFIMNQVNSKYPEDCVEYDDEFCYDDEESLMDYFKARDFCSKRGGLSDDYNLPDNVFEYFAQRNSCYWTFQSENEKSCHWYHFGQKCDRSCNENRPSICKIPSKECTLSDLRKSVPNAYFKNCSENSRPMHEITIECKEGYVLQTGPNIVRCQFDGKWSHVPQCTPGCLQPKLTKNSYLFQPKEMYEVGERAELWCNDNFISLWKYPITSIAIKCLSTGFWSDSLPECLPVDDLFYHYEFTKNKYFKKKVTAGDQVELHACKLTNSLHESLDKSISWLKDQTELRGIEGGQTFLNETDFTLQILNFSVEDEGIYTCVIKDNKSSSVLDFCSYQLRLALPVEEYLEHSLSFNLQEGSNQIIHCPSKTYFHKVHWFKDGQRLWGDNNHILMPDGSIYLQNISILNEGNYSCICDNLHSSFVRKSEIKIKINRIVACGRLDDNNAMTSARPWLATLWNEGEVMPFCYATLIDSNWLVTSATCLSGFLRKEKPNFVVKLGSSSGSFESTVSYEVLKVKMHPKYSKRLRFYDIGLIRLVANVTFTNDIYPICYIESNLHMEDYCNEFQTGTTSGWGPLESVTETDKIKFSSEILNIVTSNECNHLVRDKLPENMFCAKAETQNFSGDSGSSFEIKWKNRWYLWGVMSWGDRVTEAGDFDYFSKMISFEEWVESIISSSVLNL